MPHRFQENEENADKQIASTHQAPPPIHAIYSAEPTALRYDAQAVGEIIALAEQMQTRHRETLSADDIENLGREIGLETEFIRRALVQREIDANTPIALSPARTTARRKRDLLSGRALSQRQLAIALFPAALYLLLLLIMTPFGWVGINALSNAVVCNYVLLPAFLAIGLGIQTQSKRIGALGGGLLGIAVTVALFIVNTLGLPQMPPLMAFLPVLVVLVISGAAIGIASAGLRQIVTLPRFKRVRVVVEAEEADAKPTGQWV